MGLRIYTCFLKGNTEMCMAYSRVLVFLLYNIRPHPDSAELSLNSLQGELGAYPANFVSFR